MIDVFMLVMIIIISILLVISNIYLLSYYCHPDDRGFGAGFTAKLIVVAGMTLSWLQVLMLPLDISNQRGSGFDIPMDLLWQILYITLAAFVLIIIPTCTYYYETDSEWTTVYFFNL